MNPVIVTNQLTKWYPSQKESRPAVESVDLTVSSGTLFGIVGPDGAGKTTLLRMLATVIEPTSGQASINGCDVARQAEKVRSSIGYMPQAFSLYPDLTVIENLHFFADINGLPSAQRDRQIEGLLDFTRLADFTKRRSEHLSGGMAKKLALACALVHEPQVLLLDEPTTGVDPVSRRELWRILSQVILQGVTVMVTTPYMDEAERCNQVAFLMDGKILKTGAPDELVASLPFEILEVKARPRRTVRAVVGEIDDIRAWRPVGDRFRLSVEHFDSIEARLESALIEAGATVEMIRRARPTMEDVFTYSVEGQRDRDE